MLKKMQQMIDRRKSHKDSAGQQGALPEASPAKPSDQAKRDEWDMSPQDALQVGIVARYK